MKALFLPAWPAESEMAGRCPHLCSQAEHPLSQLNMADPPTAPVPPLFKHLCNGGNEWPPWPAHLQIFNRFLQSFDQTVITSDFGGELMLFVRGREVVGGGQFGKNEGW